MRVEVPTPQIIRDSPNSWFYTPNWRRMHCKRQQFNAMVLGQCGSGKSYATLAMAVVMDRFRGDETRFNMDQVAFSSEDFTRISNRNLPIGAAVILDDAALTAYSKDAMTREVKQVSKIFISQRRKRRCVLLSLPARDMLAKNVQQTILYAVKMHKIVESEEKSYAYVLWTSLNVWSGQLYFNKLLFGEKSWHPLHRVYFKRKYLRPMLVFDIPSEGLQKEYEKAREEATAKHYEEAERIASKKKKERRTLMDDYNFVKGNVEQFLNPKGLVDTGRIMLIGVSEYRSRYISKMLNEKRVVKDIKAI